MNLPWPKPLIMIRHPEYDAQVRPNFDAPLTERGLSQAQQVADTLRQRAKGRIVLLTSPARRTRQLAEAIGTAMDVRPREAAWLIDGLDTLEGLAQMVEWSKTDMVIAACHEPALRRTLVLADAPEGAQVIALAAIAEFSFDGRLPQLTLTRLSQK